jgi:SAM-dependent methyltransferase
LDLGCGNGRDSIYFGSLGLHVTGVDASDVAIAELCAKYQNEENICFLCADFVCAPIIYARQYDYCYSRFSIHAINDEQENDLIASVHQSLKDNGKFFIEVRSVNDELCGKGEMVGRNSYIYEGHFRRFVVKQELEQKLVNAGFCLEYSEESRGFAPYGETDPPVIRIIAKRKY